MDFRILDASAFYAGVPFRSSEDCYTTSLVYDEIKHIKKNDGSIDTLLETNRLKIMDADDNSIKLAIKASKDTGDYQQLSKQDISILALSISLKGEIISDDYAITNVAKNLGIKISSVMSNNFTDVGRWIHYCPGCRTNHSKGKECPMCGTPLRRKLFKKSSSIS